MPEGDTIHRAATRLRQSLVGQTVRTAGPGRIGELRGATVSAVEALGKHLTLRFEDGRALHTHMRMSGSWHLYRPGERWRKAPGRARAVLETDAAVAVLFDAPVAELLSGAAVDSALRRLGPDILAPGFDPVDAAARARLSTRNTLGEVLLDQSVVSGIGNIWKCESMWSLGLDPWRQVSDCSDEVLRRLYREAQRLMLSVTVTRHGHRPAVHSRGGRPCPRCHALVEVRPQGERLTYFCPGCQSQSKA